MLLLFLMVITSFVEIISIGSVVPFLGILTSPEHVYERGFTKPIFKVFGILRSEELVLSLTVFFALAALTAGTMRLMLLWGQTRLGHAIGADLSLSIYRRTLYQPYDVHLSRNSSEIISGIASKANAVVYHTVLPIFMIVASSLILLSILFVLIAIDPGMAAAAFGSFIPVYAVVMLLTKTRLARYSKQISVEDTRVIKALQEGLGGIRDVLIDGTQNLYCDIYSNADRSLRRAIANVQIIGSSPRYGIEALGMVLIAGLVYSLANSGNGIEESIPFIGAFALGAQRLLPLLQQVYAGWSAIHGGQDALYDVLELLDQPLPEYASEPPSYMAFKNNISLKNLSFEYNACGTFAIRNINLTIRKGSRVGFIGKTGSGKSTLLDILMGLLTPTGGALTIDGKLVNLSNHRAWQAHIAHVPQSIFLSDTTISENIAFGVPRYLIDMERVREAAQKSQISEIIESWDQKYDTEVGERGVRLSGGQRQRIGIARALYKNADVIIFDEATSALDNDTELAVMHSLDKLASDLTILIAAHRLTTLKNCDHVVMLDNGKIVRHGTYQEVVVQTQS